MIYLPIRSASVFGTPWRRRRPDGWTSTHRASSGASAETTPKKSARKLYCTNDAGFATTERRVRACTRVLQETFDHVIRSAEFGVLACCRFVFGVADASENFRKEVVGRHGVDERRHLNCVPMWEIQGEPEDSSCSVGPQDRLWEGHRYVQKVQCRASDITSLICCLLVGAPRLSCSQRRADRSLIDECSQRFADRSLISDHSDVQTEA